MRPCQSRRKRFVAGDGAYAVESHIYPITLRGKRRTRRHADTSVVRIRPLATMARMTVNGSNAMRGYRRRGCDVYVRKWAARSGRPLECQHPHTPVAADRCHEDLIVTGVQRIVCFAGG
jgi:hypothetical protein